MREEPKLSDGKLLEILSLSPLATAVYTGPEIRIRSVNDAMLHIWGKDKNVVGLTFEQALPDIAGQPFAGLLKTVWTTGESYEDTHAKADLVVNGTLQTFYFDFKYQAIKNDSGEIECILHTATDVTERVQAIKKVQYLQEKLAASNEECESVKNDLTLELKERIVLTKSLKESESWLRELINQAPVAMALFRGPEFIIELYNPQVLEYWGRTAAQVHNVPLFTALPEASGQGFEELLTNVLQTGERFMANEMPVTLLRNGVLGTTWINFIYDPIRDTYGKIVGIIVVCNEVTEQVKARKTVEQAEAKLQLAIDAAELGIWSANFATGLLTLTTRARQLHGLPDTAGITLKESYSMIDAEHRQVVEDAINEAEAKQTPMKVEYIIHPKDGSATRWLRATGKCTYDAAGSPEMITGTMLDITEQKKDEQRKSDFISMVSHELKTPLTSIIGYIQLLQLKTVSSDSFSSNMLGKTQKQLNKMTAMINGFLNVSRLESSQLQIDKSPVDLAALLQESEEEMATIISNHQFVFEPAAYTPVLADHDKIGHVINNLLSNAVKYSPIGSTISTACRTGNGYATVSVKDTGMGIAPQDIDKLFNRYYRATGDHMQTIGGFGIGLYLCKEIVERHQGKIWVESEPGKGSTFYFTLPVLPDAS